MAADGARRDGERRDDAVDGPAGAEGAGSGPAAGTSDGGDRGRGRRPFMAGRSSPRGSCVWFFGEAGEAVPVPFPASWSLSLVIRSD